MRRNCASQVTFRNRNDFRRVPHERPQKATRRREVPRLAFSVARRIGTVDSRCSYRPEIGRAAYPAPILTARMRRSSDGRIDSPAVWRLRDPQR